MTRVQTSIDDDRPEQLFGGRFRTRKEYWSDLARRRAARRKVHTRICVECGRVMKDVYDSRKYCSNRCKLRYKRRGYKPPEAST